MRLRLLIGRRVVESLAEITGANVALPSKAAVGDIGATVTVRLEADQCSVADEKGAGSYLVVRRQPRVK